MNAQQITAMPISGLQASTLPLQAAAIPATVGTAQTGIDIDSMMSLMITMMIVVMMMKMMTGAMSGVTAS